MVNSDKFSKRLQKILEYYDLSAAGFADAIDVGRSSISHILSGRNKPSLDFVLKIVQTYPEVELYWLLNGKGEFPYVPNKQHESATPPPTPSVNIKPEENTAANTSTVTDSDKSMTQINRNSAGKEIKKIVIFYEDGTFDAFEN
jgi:transcriptional regulator with XRE-family HTH domain